MLAFNNRYARLLYFAREPLIAFGSCRRLLWNFQYFMVFANSTIGLVSCLIRIIKAVFFGAWTLSRLDVSMLNRHFERFDNGKRECLLLLMLLLGE